MDESSKESVVATTGKAAPARKPYQRPVLAKWGGLRDMTQSTGHAGKPDGGKAGWSKTTGRGGHFVVKD